ncbi:uncharacterized protein TRIADDRAFT_54608 [Trichoplax adhaerens]|uniref:Uncharacterized protein n=1 Tax=Trichoplax adhaerens TaxID=10228 RepID=B3RSI4_TRIAD|nr:predicted protein [Trichoplax adhaerens]EDV26517.1 predicted protein [Trichoplax adhaerens]|eukprot:XP_002110513.1 predicted protein [Trichoplax adhaerens]
MPSPQKITTEDLVRAENGSYLFNNRSYSTASETLNAYIEKYTGYTISDASADYHRLTSVLLASTPVRQKPTVEKKYKNTEINPKIPRDHNSINGSAIVQAKLKFQQLSQVNQDTEFLPTNVRRGLNYQQNLKADAIVDNLLYRNDFNSEGVNQSSNLTINQSKPHLKNQPVGTHFNKVKFEAPMNDYYRNKSNKKNWTEKDWIKYWSSQAQSNHMDVNQSMPSLSSLPSPENTDVDNDDITSNATSDVDVGQLIDMYRDSLRKNKIKNDENKRFIRQMRFRYGSPELKSNPSRLVYESNSRAMRNNQFQNQPPQYIDISKSLSNNQDEKIPKLNDQYHNGKENVKIMEKERYHDLESVKTDELLLYSPNGIPSEREKANMRAKYNYHHLYDKIAKLKKIAEPTINDDIESTVTDQLLRKSPMPYISVSPTPSDFTLEGHDRTAISNHSNQHYRTVRPRSPIRSPRHITDTQAKGYYNEKRTPRIKNNNDKKSNGTGHFDQSLEFKKHKQDLTNEPRPIETLKQMIFNVQAAASESDDVSDCGALIFSKGDVHEAHNDRGKMAINDPLQRAIHHLARLKAFVHNENSN